MLLTLEHSPFKLWISRFNTRNRWLDSTVVLNGTRIRPTISISAETLPEISPPQLQIVNPRTYDRWTRKENQPKNYYTMHYLPNNIKTINSAVHCLEHRKNNKYHHHYYIGGDQTKCLAPRCAANITRNRMTLREVRL